MEEKSIIKPDFDVPVFATEKSCVIILLRDIRCEKLHVRDAASHGLNVPRYVAMCWTV